MKHIKLTTNSPKETQNVARLFAKELMRFSLVRNGALVVALEGDLGGGKTTFAQGFARGLGIREKVLSPTFVIMRIFNLRKVTFRRFVHIDAYRLKGVKELQPLGWRYILQDRETIVLVEWADRVRRALPKGYIQVKFEFLSENERHIIIQSAKFKVKSYS